MTRSHAGAPAVLRGRIYGADIKGQGEKYYLVVSNNQRNRVLPDFLAVRLTTTRKPELDTIVVLDRDDAPWTGCVLVDDLQSILHDQVTRDAGALRRATMRRVDAALRVALGI